MSRTSVKNSLSFKICYFHIIFSYLRLINTLVFVILADEPRKFIDGEGVRALLGYIIMYPYVIFVIFLFFPFGGFDNQYVFFCIMLVACSWFCALLLASSF